MKISYDEQATLYENTRNINPQVYSMLSCLLAPIRGEKILDFGCGTGNYLQGFVRDYGIDPYGVEPSVNMRKIAQRKLQGDCIRDGNHMHIPFVGYKFKKIYSTDVIHHIRQIDALFQNLLCVSTKGTRFCICTESHLQLSEKYWIQYFPEVLEIDYQRFHTIDTIIKSGERTGWVHKETVQIEDELIAPISQNFMDRVRQKTLSVFHLISEDSYAQGLALMEVDYHSKRLIHQHEGYTFVVFEKVS